MGNLIVKLQLKKSTLSIIGIVLGLTTMTFAILSMLNSENLSLRLVTQFCRFLLMLFSGFVAIYNLKKKALGWVLLGVCILILVSMIFTHAVALRNNVF